MFGFWKSKRSPARPETSGHAGYYPLYESPGSMWGEADDEDAVRYRSGSRQRGFAEWDRKLAELDAQVEEQAGREERHRQRWWRPSYWRQRGKLWWAGHIGGGLILLFILIVGWLAVTAPLSKSLEPIAPAQITLLAADGTPIARNGAIVDAPVDIDTLPPHVVEAFLAVEDRRFYSHWGVDPRGIARAAITGYGGGSTITQQLAKFTFLTPERSLTRKAREMLIAFWLESWLTKDEILERYLSNAYFGDNVYGLRAASLHYFYRKPEKLKPEQAMMLAGLVQAPSRYAPTRHFERAKERWDVVKVAMVGAGYMTQAEVDALPVPRVDSRTRNDLPTGTYFADWALPEARRMTENGYSRQTLTTTLDARLQNIARNVTARAPLGNAQVALVAMRPTGEVVAMIGGKDYAASPFNRATQARRQPGSTFKTFVYLAALQAGWDPEDTISNQPFEAGSYRPKNAGGRYSDKLTLEQAFAGSSNVAAVRLLEEVGSKRVIATARALGVTAPLPEGDPSLALGTTSMTLMELTAAYAGIAANDFPIEPHAFPVNKEGWLASLFNGRSSLSGRSHKGIERLLRSAVNNGTGRAAMLPGENFGKTGTSQDNRDALFIGYAGDLVVGVWIGNDDNAPLRDISGGGLPARIWRDFMRQAQGAGATDRPRATPSTDPSGPVQPLDLPEPEIPLDGLGSALRIEQDGLTVSTEVEGVPLDIRVDSAGLSVNPPAGTDGP